MENQNKENETGFLGKDAILGAEDLKRERVEVPEWNGAVYVGTMTAAERDAFEASMVTEKEEGKPQRNMDNFRAKLVASTILNANGKRMFTLEEARELGKKSASAINRIFQVAARLNGVGQQDVEELTKN